MLHALSKSNVTCFRQDVVQHSINLDVCASWTCTFALCMVYIDTPLSLAFLSSSHLHWWLSEWWRVCGTRDVQLFHGVDWAKL